jgi:hypothetical protein
VISRSDILTDSQNEAALEQIQMLEDSSRYRKHVTDDVTIVQPPQFTRPLHNLETIEGTNVHLECRLQPVGDPTMRVDWFVNGRPVPTGKYGCLTNTSSFLVYRVFWFPVGQALKPFIIAYKIASVKSGME